MSLFGGQLLYLPQVLSLQFEQLPPGGRSEFIFSSTIQIGSSQAGLTEKPQPSVCSSFSPVKSRTLLRQQHINIILYYVKYKTPRRSSTLQNKFMYSLRMWEDWGRKGPGRKKKHGLDIGMPDLSPVQPQNPWHGPSFLETSISPSLKWKVGQNGFLQGEVPGPS